MHNLPLNEVNEICYQLGLDFPKNIKELYGGNIHRSWQLEFKKEKFFLKRNSRRVKYLKFEENCLKGLRKNINEQYLIIPKVISYYNNNSVRHSNYLNH